MKRFIKWLCRISGVYSEIRYETIREYGGQIAQDSHWFGANPDACNVLHFTGMQMKEYAHHDISKVRDDVHDCKGVTIHKILNDNRTQKRSSTGE